MICTQKDAVQATMQHTYKLTDLFRLLLDQ